MITALTVINHTVVYVQYLKLRTVTRLGTDVKRHYLREIPDFEKEIVNKLEDLWINSAEKLVSHTATSELLHKMADYLNIKDEEMERYRTIARSYVPKDLLTRLETTHSKDEYSFGARLDRKKYESE